MDYNQNDPKKPSPNNNFQLPNPEDQNLEPSHLKETNFPLPSRKQCLNSSSNFSKTVL